MDQVKWILQWITLFYFFGNGCHGKCDIEGIAPRLCNGDFTTPGRCFELFEEKTHWNQAQKSCRKWPGGGHLAVIDSQVMQDFVKQQVAKKGWPYAWINGFLKTRLWFYSRYGSYLAYQGCYIDDLQNPDLPHVQNLTSGSKPSQCLEACDMDQFKFASIQMNGNNMICRCSNTATRKYDIVYESECDTLCPKEEKAASVINRFCGGKNRQLVFRADGKRFQLWIPTEKRFYAECVSYDHNHHHFWLERDCKDTIGYVCDYSIWSEGSCTRKSKYHRWLKIGDCVSIHNGQWNFYEAATACVRNGGQLHRPTSGEDFDQLRALLDKNTSYYFGLTHERWELTTWKLVTKYFNWGTNQPGGSEDAECFRIQQSDDYRWHNVNCEYLHPYVCSVDICKEENSTSPTLPSNTMESTTSEQKNASGTLFSESFFIGLGSGVGSTLGIVGLIIFIVLICMKCRGNSSSHQERNNSNRPSNTTVPSGGGRNYRTSNNHRSVSQNGSYVDINGDLVGGHYEGLEPKYDHPYLKPI